MIKLIVQIDKGLSVIAVLFKEYREHPVEQIGVVKALQFSRSILPENYGFRLRAVVVNGQQYAEAFTFADHPVEQLTLYLSALLIGEQNREIIFLHEAELCFAITAENINDLMLYKLLDGGAGGL